MGNPDIIDPWGSVLIDDYIKVISQFHLESFDAKKYPGPNRLMRREVVFSGVGQKQILDCIKNKKSFYVLSGIMPTGDKIHFGNKMVIENIRYFQEHGGHAYVVVADLEAHATREVSLEEARKRALDFHIPAYIALGLDPKKTTFYFQSENSEVLKSAAIFSKKVTFNQFKALYGHADPAHIMSALIQTGDILFPQFKKRMPGIIPVGVDQIPHILLARDIVGRMKKEKFYPPSAIFHKYTPSLDGSMKMSKSKPESMISLPEDPKQACKKIKRALSGGRESLEEHRKLGAIIEQDMPFEMLKQHLLESDEELNSIYEQYKAGKLTSGEVKQVACDNIATFMQELEKGIKDARKMVKDLHFIRS